VTGDVSETFLASETRAVSANLDETISGNRTQTIVGSSTETIVGSLSQTLTGGATITTPAAYTINAAAGVTITAPGGVTIVSPGGHTLIAPGGQTVVDGSHNQSGTDIKDLVAFIGIEGAKKADIVWGLKVAYATMKKSAAGFKTTRPMIQMKMHAMDQKMGAVAMSKKDTKVTLLAAVKTLI